MTRHVIAPLLVACTWAMGAAKPPAASAQETCPPGTGPALTAAWNAYRADSVDLAAARFREVVASCPKELDAKVGMGFALLRLGQTDEARLLFDAVVAADSSSTDAWEGRALGAGRAGDTPAAIVAWRRVLALDPTRADAIESLDRLAPGWDESQEPLEKRRAPTLDLATRVRGEGFEILRDGRWEPFFIKGVNMGMALPGKFPSEFPRDSTLYARWFGEIGDMAANTVRVYTVLPPEFYRALRDHNLAHPQRPLHLVHGVWTELPPGNDFDDTAFNAGFLDEIHDVVDVVHGAVVIAPRPGHASGRYDADVSPWTVAYILGREWEPYSVLLYNELAGENRTYRGRFLTIEDAAPTDVWMVKQCDLMVQYEMTSYNAQRPIAYTNWPTTDPIVHPTETSYAQQMQFRGLIYDRDPSEGPPHEEEGVVLDPSLAHPTGEMVAGWFASYHVYPYYPDFMLYDPGYNRASSSFGRSNYFGYLQDLRSHHAGIPLVISEFGIPTSRGTAHLQPQGWNHGGIDEADAAGMVVRLAAEIRESGAAGAIVFAWIDEWFKRNWFSADFELPEERGRLWHNIMSPEQHYGIVALRPGAEGKSPMPGGDPERWHALPVLQSGLLDGADSTALRVGNDEGFLYLALETPALRGRPFPWDSMRVQIAIDTHRPDLGQMVLPMSGLRSGSGFEFLIELNRPDSATLRVLPDYNPYEPYRLTLGGAFFGEHFRRPVVSVPRLDGAFDPLWALTNRPRFTNTGALIRGQGVDLGVLTYGTAAELSLADWWYDPSEGMIQIRIPWLLLNVSDPSSHRVLTESTPASALAQGVAAPPSRLVGSPTDGFRFAVVGLDTAPNLLGTIPALDDYGNWPLAAFKRWLWEGWEIPTFHEYRKPLYHALKRHWEGR